MEKNLILPFCNRLEMGPCAITDPLGSQGLGVLDSHENVDNENNAKLEEKLERLDLPTYKEKRERYDRSVQGNEDNGNNQTCLYNTPYIHEVIDRN